MLCYRLSDTDPSKVNFANAVKAFCMFNDMMISQDGIIEGYIVVFDMKGLRLGHLAKIQLSALRTFMAYIQVSVIGPPGRDDAPVTELTLLLRLLLLLCLPRKRIRFV